MRCCERWIASVALLTFYVAPSYAAVDSRWAWGWQFAMVRTHQLYAETPLSYGMQAQILRRVVPNAWVGVEGGFYEHQLIPFVTAADDWRPYPLQGPVYSSRLALVTQIGPAWAYRPYVTGGLGVVRLTDLFFEGADAQQSLHYELGLGLRGSDRLLPWFEWRWHRSFDRLGFLFGEPLEYQTWGIGLGWN